MTVTLQRPRVWPAGTPDAFDPAALDDLPAPAAAYLSHAIAPGARLPDRVRITTHGHIRIGAWLPFTAVQTIERDRRSTWSARVAGGLLCGSDELDRNRARNRVGLFDRVPVARASGRDVTRSALGRFHAELTAWLPGCLLPGTGTHWHLDDHGDPSALVPHDGGYARICLRVADDGRLRGVSLLRWGRDAGRHGWIPFGMVATQERTFGDFTVASAGRVGWWYGTPRWRSGEFLRFTVDDYTAL
jgi:hypothetical protein